MKYFLIYIREQYDGYDGTMESMVHYLVSTQDEGLIANLTLIKANDKAIDLPNAIKSLLFKLGFDESLIGDDGEDYYPLEWEDGWLSYGDDQEAWNLTRIEVVTATEFEILKRFNIGLTVSDKQLVDCFEGE
jgi:hypothetical protein